MLFLHQVASVHILDKFLNILTKWNGEIQDTVLWPDIYNMCLKYAPFMEYDDKKIKHII